MPFVNIRITRDGATAEQKATLIKGATQLLVDVGDQTSRVLQPGHVDVAVHPVDAINFENHVIVKDIGNTAR